MWMSTGSSWDHMFRLVQLPLIWIIRLQSVTSTVHAFLWQWMPINLRKIWGTLLWTSWQPICWACCAKEVHKMLPSKEVVTKSLSVQFPKWVLLQLCRLLGSTLYRNSLMYPSCRGKRWALMHPAITSQFHVVWNLLCWRHAVFPFLLRQHEGRGPLSFVPPCDDKLKATSGLPARTHQRRTATVILGQGWPVMLKICLTIQILAKIQYYSYMYNSFYCNVF